MFERLTERARQVVHLAWEEAHALKHRYIGTEHLLLGLLREGEGLASQVLAARGMTADGVRDAVLRLGGSGTDHVTPHPDPFKLEAFARDAATALECALREALVLGHNYIGTEHILLGLVRHDEGLATRVLDDLGEDRQTIRAEVIRWLLGAGPAQPHASPQGAEPEQGELTDEELEGMLAELTHRETRVSRELRILRGRIDILRAELDGRRGAGS